MAKEELIPGVEITVTDPEEDSLQEVAERHTAARVANEAEVLERRKQATLTQVGIRLQKGLPVPLTEEMDELGIREQVIEMRLQADMHWKLLKHLQNSEDHDRADDWLD